MNNPTDTRCTPIKHPPSLPRTLPRTHARTLAPARIRTNERAPTARGRAGAGLLTRRPFGSTAVDADGDGAADAIGLDTDGDGRVDAVVLPFVREREGGSVGGRVGARGREGGRVGGKE